MKKLLLVTSVTLFTTQFSFAGECIMKIHRTACPGKETEAFKPYNGKVETEEKKDTADLAACEKLAEKSAKIVRKGTLSAKKVNATFGGKPLAKTYQDQSDCK